MWGATRGSHVAAHAPRCATRHVRLAIPVPGAEVGAGSDTGRGAASPEGGAGGRRDGRRILPWRGPARTYTILERPATGGGTVLPIHPRPCATAAAHAASRALVTLVTLALASSL